MTTPSAPRHEVIQTEPGPTSTSDRHRPDGRDRLANLAGTPAVCPWANAYYNGEYMVNIPVEKLPSRSPLSAWWTVATTSTGVSPATPAQHPLYQRYSSTIGNLDARPTSNLRVRWRTTSL